MKLEFSEQEAAALLECVDTTLGVHKIKALGVANMIVNKINHARQLEQNEKTTQLQSSSPPVTGALG